MPIHYEVYYDVSTNDHDCGPWDPDNDGPLEVHLVATNSARYPDPRGDDVEEIVIYYTEATGGGYPSAAFQLRLQNTRHTLSTPPQRDLLDGEPESGSSAVDRTVAGTGYYEWHFTAPSGPSTTLFQFDDGSGPPSKLKVKIKQQTGNFSC